MTTRKEGRELRRRWPAWAKVLVWVGGMLVVAGGIVSSGISGSGALALCRSGE